MTHRGSGPLVMNGPLSASASERRTEQEKLRLVPSGVDDPQFAVVFARNGDRDLVRNENRADRWDRKTGGWCQNPRKDRLRGRSFCELTPPLFLDFRHTPPWPPMALDASILHLDSEPGHSDLQKLNEGGGGSLFRKKRGGAAAASVGAIHPSPRCLGAPRS